MRVEQEEIINRQANSEAIADSEPSTPTPGLRGEDSNDVPIFAAPVNKSRKTKVTSGGGPVTKFDVCFRDVTVTVQDRKDRKQRKQLISNVSGYVPAGDVLMVLGSSGCGKSTLLQTIANVTKTGTEVTGEVLFNSKRLRRADRRQILSFVPQESPLLGEFTVHETLWFAARLYFGYTETPRFAIQQKIDSIIKSLGLDSCRDVVVGNLFFRGLSGGQRKRLSIAVELISSPAVIVLDEPTSGLDSSVALQLVESLQALASVGHTIVATIHQPSSHIWKNFTNIMLMSEGKMVYFGSADRSVDYFTSIGLHCPETFNPADYFSAVLSKDFPDALAVSNKSAEELAALYENSAHRRMELGVHLEAVNETRKTKARTNHKKSGRKFGSKLETKPGGDPEGLIMNRYDNLDDPEHDGPKPKVPRRSLGAFLTFGASSKTSMKQSGFFSSTISLLHRFLKSLYREPGMLLTRILVYLGLGLILGLVYLDVGKSSDTEALLGIASVLLGLTGFFSFLAISAIPFVMDNQAVLEREQRNGSYPIASYVVARVLSLIPATLILAGIAVMFVGSMCQLLNLGLFFICLWNLLFCAECLVQVLGSIAPRVETGVAIAVGIFAFLFLCSGFFTPVPQMSWAVRWITYVSPIRYAFRAFMRNEFESIGTTDSLQFPTGTAVLDFFELNAESVQSFWADMGIVLAHTIAYIILLYIFTRLRVTR